MFTKSLSGAVCPSSAAKTVTAARLIICEYDLTATPSTSDVLASATAGKACNGMDLFEFLTNALGTTREQLESAVSFWTQMCIVGELGARCVPQSHILMVICRWEGSDHGCNGGCRSADLDS